MSSWNRFGWRALCLALALVSFATTVRAQEETGYLPFQGYLADAEGTPLDGSVTLTFTLYNTPTPTGAEGEVLYKEQTPVNVENGNFSVYIGDVVALKLDIFRQTANVFVGVLVEGDSEELKPLLQLGSAPYAAFAQYCGDAATLGGRTAEQIESSAANASLPKTGGTVTGDVTVEGKATASSFELASARTEWVTVPGAAFVHQAEGDQLVQHAPSGSLYFSSAATAGNVFPVAYVAIPSGATITSASCNFLRSTNTEIAFFELYRVQGGTSTRLGVGRFSSGSGETGNNVTLSISALTEQVSHPGRSYLIATGLTNSAAGGSAGRLKLNDCQVSYTRASL